MANPKQILTGSDRKLWEAEERAMASAAAKDSSLISASGAPAVEPAVVVGGGVAKRLDTKGRPLITGAWYALFDGPETQKNVGGALLAQWAGSFVDENGEPAERVYDSDVGWCDEEYEHALLQQCDAATRAGVTP